MSYIQTLRDLANNKSIDLQTLAEGKPDGKGGAVGRVFKGTATTDQRTAFAKAHEAYVGDEGKNLGEQTKVARARLNAAYESAAGAVVDKKKSLDAAEAIVKEAEAVRAANTEALAAKATYDKLHADKAPLKEVSEARNAYGASTQAAGKKSAQFKAAHPDLALTKGIAVDGSAIVEDKRFTPEDLHAKAAGEHTKAVKRADRVAKVEHNFLRGDGKIYDVAPQVVTEQVDGKDVKRRIITGDKVRNEEVNAKKYRNLDETFSEVVDGEKLKAAEKAAKASKVNVAAVSGSASSLAEAHKTFNPFDGISAEALKGEKVKPLHEKFHAALAEVEKDPEVAGKLNALKSAHGNVKAYEVAKTAESDAGFKAAKEALAKAQKEVDEVLKVSDKSSKAVKDFAEASKNASKLQGNFGNYHAQGVVGAAKSNLNYKSPGNSAGKVFGRVAAMTAGAGLTVHAFQAKTADGQDRSWVTRTAEGVAGLGLMGAGAVMGKVRV